MASVVQICNMALARVGVSKQIVSLGEASNEARLCSLFFDDMRDVVLADFPWPFASRYVSLARLSDEPIVQYRFAYAYPTDCLFAQRIVPEGGAPKRSQERIPFEIDYTLSGNTKRILCSEETPILKYTARVTNTVVFSAPFVSALAWRMASEVGLPLSAQANLIQAATNSYAKAISEAKAHSFNEGQEDPIYPDDSELVMVRFS